jgi:hypothetical protein
MLEGIGLERLTGAARVFGIDDLDIHLNTVRLAEDFQSAGPTESLVLTKSLVGEIDFGLCTMKNQQEIAFGALADPYLILRIVDQREVLAWGAFPLSTILDGSPSIEGYTVYIHQLSTPEGWLGAYVGVTGQPSWVCRWSQHKNAADSGCTYRFHTALRASAPNRRLAHIVAAVGLTYEAAMALEERLVAGLSLYPRGLNMIPGGFEGHRYLGCHGINNISARRWEYRSALIRQLASDCEREGKPNPLLAARWRDDEYAASVICGNPRNFGLDQVRHIRTLAQVGWESANIADFYGCRPERIRSLVRGATYARAH